MEYYGLPVRPPCARRVPRTRTAQIALDGYPDESLIRRARLIILADMPLTEDVLTHEMQDNLLAAVRAGARMVVTGGLSGLEHCGDLKAPIIRALPVRLKDPWHPAKPSGKTVAKYGKGAICVVTGSGNGRVKSKCGLSEPEGRRRLAVPRHEQRRHPVRQGRLTGGDDKMAGLTNLTVRVAFFRCFLTCERSLAFAMQREDDFRKLNNYYSGK